MKLQASKRNFPKNWPVSCEHLEIKAQYGTCRKEPDVSFESDTSSVLPGIERSLWCGLPGGVVS